MSYDFTPRNILGANGLISKTLPGYQVREPQIELAEKIQSAFEAKKHLIAEAATGTGKSFAILLGAFKKCFEATPIVISTHTITLQEQLCEKDVPFLLERLGLNINVTLAKGRGNYISLRREKVAQKERHLQQNKEFYNWLDNTNDGTLKTLPFKPTPFFWNRVRSDTDQCYGEQCEFFEACFYQKSRRELAESHIIITNHNMVLLDLKMKSEGLKGVLPDYKYLVIDEAHELEEVARKVFTFEIKQNDIPSLFYELHNENKTGFLDEFSRNANTLSIEDTIATENQQMERKAYQKTINDTMEAVTNLFEANKVFFERVSEFVDGQPIRRFKIKNEIETDLFDKISATLANLKALTNLIEDRNHKIALDFVLKKCTEIGMNLDKLLNLPNLPDKDFTDIVAWGGERKFGKTKFNYVVCAPIFLQGLFKKIVFNPLDSVILTSATLTTSSRDPFRLFKNIIGVPEPYQVQLPPVFDYKKQCQLVLVKDMPKQSDNNYYNALSVQTLKWIRVSKGHAFVLFTSFKTMTKVYETIKNNLELEGCTVFVQGGDLKRDQMIEKFKTSPRPVLFGVTSFWTGVDIPGKALQNVIITKIPFLPPNDPLVEAQTELFEKWGRDFFRERSVPKATLMLKQGFGRLIRRSTDKGIVVILDSRIIGGKGKGNYGKSILAALPDCTRKICTP